MNKKKQTYSIRGKLVSAACMLLVAIIMVVSSTYAWFTLSTAPEVTGMQTAIGANGALEMALWNGSEPLTGIVGENQPNTTTNKYWGNLVDLSDGYGLNKIVLNPSKLNITDGKIGAFPLAIPEYGADGRVTKLDYQGTLTGTFDGQNFYEDDEYGVRGIGAASGMTDRQLAYRDAKSLAANATASAKSKASAVLNAKGSALANIALEHGMGSNESYNATDVEALRALIDGTKEALANIENAYKYYIAAFATSKLGATDDTQALAVYSTATDSSKSLQDVIDILATNNVTLPSELSGPISNLKTTISNVDKAETALETLETTLESDASATFTWNQIDDAMTPLASTSAMKINGFTVDEVKADTSAFIADYTDKGGLTVTMGTGAGVFADIADHCGNYTASIVIAQVEYNGLVLNNVKARMATETSVSPYLPAYGVVAEAAGAPEGTGTKLPFSEFYGYIIDMAFRTNAAESDLLLQTEALDRIYGQNNNNEATMGHGSTMAFKSDDTNFSNDQLKALMENLRVVFFTPDTTKANLGTVLVYAKLDMSKAFINENSEVEAPLVLYTETTTVTYAKDANGNYLKDDGSIAYYFNSTDSKYYAEQEFTTVVEEANMTGRKVESTTTNTTLLEGDDAIITALPQNTTVAVSALVYLDGESMTNEHVSATATQSMYGKMNLQFSSSATLVPMEYADLHTPNANN